MSTFTCSTRRRASASATSGVASEQPFTNADRVPADRDALDEVARLLADRGAAVLDVSDRRAEQRGLVEGRKRPLQGHHADLDRRGCRATAGADRDE